MTYPSPAKGKEQLYTSKCESSYPMDFGQVSCMNSLLQAVVHAMSVKLPDISLHVHVNT